MFLLYFLIWMILCGEVNGEILLFGVLSSALLTFFSYRVMGCSARYDRLFLRKFPQELSFFLYLLREMIVAALVMMKLIYSRKIEPKPLLISFSTTVRSRGAQAALANAITLTAGTITVTADEREFYIHTLDASLAVGIEKSEFAERLQRLEE